MKKTYTSPAAEVIDLFIEAPILAGTTEMDVTDKTGVNNELGILTNKTIWNYNEDDEK